MEYKRRHGNIGKLIFLLFLTQLTESSLVEGLNFVVERGSAELPDKIISATNSTLLRVCTNDSLILASPNVTLSCLSHEQFRKTVFGAKCGNVQTLRGKDLKIDKITNISSLYIWEYKRYYQFEGKSVSKVINITTNGLIFINFNSWKGLLARVDYNKNIDGNETSGCLLLRFPGNRTHPLPDRLEEIIITPILQAHSTESPTSETSPSPSVTNTTTKTTTTTTTRLRTTRLTNTMNADTKMTYHTTSSPNKNDTWNMQDLTVLTSTPATHIKRKNHINKILMIACASLAFGSLCLIIAIACICWKRKKFKKQRKNKEADQSIPMDEIDETRKLLNIHPLPPNNSALYEPIAKDKPVRQYEPVRRYETVRQYDDTVAEYEPVAKYNPQRNHIQMETGNPEYASVSKCSENDNLLAKEYEPSREEARLVEENVKNGNNYEILPNHITQNSVPANTWNGKRNYENIDNKTLNLYDEPISQPVHPNNALYAVVDKSKKGI